ncbi:hypothetical protein SBRY_40069 [Actinacidiphila bryophytorum]|uniref:Uncharacterized protein n=1 Tax=Actinacidiphila bryophytorum TaxID=1436133 RepID=A0A9W4MG85_9ACTN|nr:hypothetical protein SBRY_40069 [Actinacidiphila bryophytorum]
MGSRSPKGTAVTEKNRKGPVASAEALCTESPGRAAKVAPTGMPGLATVSATPSTVMVWRAGADAVWAAGPGPAEPAAWAAGITPSGTAKAAATTAADRIRDVRSMDVSSDADR